MFMQNFVTVQGNSIRQESAFYDSAEDVRVSYVDARDVSRVAARVLTEFGHEDKTYDLSGPEAVSYDEIAELFSQVLGRTIRYVRISDEEYLQRFLDVGASDEEGAAWADISRYLRTGACSAVTSGVQDLTGRKPVSFEEFCRDYAPKLA